MRPLLSVPRDTIEAYATQAGLQWVEDESNENREFERNFLRHDILPLLEERWPGFSQAVSRSARLCGKQQRLIAKECESRLQELLLPNGALDIDKLSVHGEEWRAELLRFWFEKQGATLPSESILAEIEKILWAKDDANPQVIWAKKQVRRFQGALYFLECKDSLSQVSLNFSKHGQFELADELGILTLSESITEMSLPLVTGRESFELRFEGFGTKFKPEGATVSKPLKQWFKLWNVPPWERERTPQLYLNDELIGIVTREGLFASQHYLSKVNSAKVFLTLRRP